MENEQNQNLNTTQQTTVPPVTPPPTQAPPSNSQDMPPPLPEKEFETRTLIAILLLVFVYPIGLIFMWFGTKWPKWVKFLITAPIILAILGIALAVFLATLDPSHKIEEARSRIVKPVTSTPVDETANWKTYTSPKNTFSLKAPSSWVTDNATSEEMNLFGDVECLYLRERLIVISACYRPQKLSETIFDKVPERSTAIKKTVNGYIAYFEPDENTYYILRKDDTFILLKRGVTLDEKIFEAVVSTFKFTDSSDETANWKTFTTKSGVSFKYPSDWQIKESITPKDSGGYGPWEWVTVTSPNGIVVHFNDNISGLGGGCDPADCPYNHVLKVEPINIPNYETLNLVELVVKDSADSKVLYAQAGLVDPKTEIKVGSIQEFGYYLVFPDKNSQRVLDNFLTKIDVAKLGQLTDLSRYFKDPEVQTAEKIIKTLAF